jgi:hypothetical protein
MRTPYGREYRPVDSELEFGICSKLMVTGPLAIESDCRTRRRSVPRERVFSPQEIEHCARNSVLGEAPQLQSARPIKAVYGFN